jgi:hypothetical protein
MDADMEQVVPSTIGHKHPMTNCCHRTTDCPGTAFLMIMLIRYILGTLATVGAAYAAPVLFHFFRALSLVQIG